MSIDAVSPALAALLAEEEAEHLCAYFAARDAGYSHHEAQFCAERALLHRTMAERVSRLEAIRMDHGYPSVR